MVRGLNFCLLDAMKEYKEWFYDDFVIESAYGCPATCIWNGGRNIDVFEKGFNENIIDLIFTVYESFGIKYRLIFTNSLLRKEHLENKVGNALAKMLDKRGGSVMVSTGMMANYMLRYHGLQINRSTTTNFGKNTDDIMIKINELTKKHLVVLPCELNNSPLIDQLENHGNIELLVNELCVDNCRKRREHWEITNKYILKNAMNDRNILLLS